MDTASVGDIFAKHWLDTRMTQIEMGRSGFAKKE